MPSHTGAVTSLPRVSATRYVQPLREGGSLPAVVETSDGLYVVKFRGAGQGTRALVAELIVGLLAQALDLPVPDLALVDVPPPFGRSEPDPEIQDLLQASHGVNVGVRYLDGAFNFDAKAAAEFVTGDFATRLVWLDAFVTNPDRTHRNPNLLIWQRRPWLIDHGAALYWHHDWDGSLAGADRKFPLVKDHVLLRWADALPEASRWLARGLSDAVIEAAVAEVPAAWLDEEPAAAEARRAAYVTYLRARREAAQGFVQEAIDAHARL